MKTFKILGGLGVLLALSITTQAALLLPGGGPVGAPLQAGPGPVPAPANILTSPFAFGGLAGTITSWVVAGDPVNPFAGGLSFYYQVNNTGAVAIGDFAASGFGAMPVDVWTINLAAPWDGALLGGFSPFAADRPVPGDAVTFSFSAPLALPVGGHSWIMVVHTPSVTWGPANGAVIDGFAANATILAPVPEPATMIAGALLLLPFGASTFRFVRRH